MHQFAALVLNCGKPIIITSFNEKNIKVIIEMAAAAVGSMEKLREHPFLILYTEPISPLVQMPCRRTYHETFSQRDLDAHGI